MFYIVWKYITRLSVNRTYKVLTGDVDHLIGEGWNFVLDTQCMPLAFDNEYDADTELYTMPIPFLSFDENEALEIEVEMDLEQHKEYEMLRRIRSYKQDHRREVR